MWGIRVIIPAAIRQKILEELHAGHLGMSKMKGLARSHVWWPKMDSEIEQLCKSCLKCQSTQVSPASAPIHMWEFPENPWSRIHIDFVGPYLGHMFLIVVVAHSKWPDVCLMQSTSACKTVDVLRTIFARNGLPQLLNK